MIYAGSKQGAAAGAPDQGRADVERPVEVDAGDGGDGVGRQ